MVGRALLSQLLDTTGDDDEVDGFVEEDEDGDTDDDDNNSGNAMLTMANLIREGVKKNYLFSSLSLLRVPATSPPPY